MNFKALSTTGDGSFDYVQQVEKFPFNITDFNKSLIFIEEQTDAKIFVYKHTKEIHASKDV